MAQIFEILKQDLTDERIDLIADKIGSDRERTRDAIAVTLPAIVEALGRRMDEPGGESQFQNHLFNQRSTAAEVDSGSMLDTLNDIIENGGSRSPRTSTKQAPADTSGDMVSDLFGKRKERVKDAVSKTSGIGLEQAGSLIAILGPLVVGMLAKQQAKNKLDPGDLSGMVKEGRAKVQQSSVEASLVSYSIRMATVILIYSTFCR